MLCMQDGGDGKVGGGWRVLECRNLWSREEDGLSSDKISWGGLLKGKMN
jgi:hypothetical protein